MKRRSDDAIGQIVGAYFDEQETSVEKDTFNQFGYACKQFGIDIRTSSVQS